MDNGHVLCLLVGVALFCAGLVASCGTFRKHKGTHPASFPQGEYLSMPFYPQAGTQPAGVLLFG